MRMNLYLKKILTWAIMSTVGITAFAGTISGGELAADAIEYEKTFRAGLRIKQQQLACLARNVYYEARGESLQGQIAVAQVTVNRVKSSKFPNDVCKVVAQSKVVGETKICQFSWYCDSKHNKNKFIHETHPSYIAAKKVLLEGYRIPHITKDTYFFHRHDVEIQPGWKRNIVAHIGDHVFYKRH